MLHATPRLTRLWHRPALLLLLAAPLLAACDKDDDTTPAGPTTEFGTSVALGTGSAKTYVTSDAAGNPTAIGIRVTEAALTSLPTTMAMLDLALPGTAGKTPYDHVTLDWNPAGHEPVGIYNLPHFDAHFYMVPIATQHAIVLDDAKGDLFPTATMLPGVYVTPPNVVPGRTVPMMGRHWTDSTSAEFHGSPFTSTFIYGTYDSHVAFMEPMFTKALLTTSLNMTAPIKQPAAYEHTGKYYPTNYNLRYDASTHEYVIALNDLVKR